MGLRITNPIDRGTQLWRTEPIGNIVQKVETENPRKQYPDKEFLYVDISGIDNLRGVIKKWKTVRGKDAPSRARQKIRRDDVLVSTVRPNLNATALVPDFLDGQICSTGFCVLRSNGSVLPKYLYFFTRMSSFGKLLSSRTRGASYPAVTDSDVKELKIPVPRIETQQQIVSLLERVHKLRQTREEANQLANRIVQSVFLKMFGDPAVNEKGLRTEPLRSVLRERLAHGLSLIRANVREEPVGVPVLKLSALTDSGLDPSQIKYYEEQAERIEPWLLKKDDILVSRSNTIELVGRVGRYVGYPTPCIFPDLMIRVRTDSTIVEPVYLEFYLRSSFVKTFFQRRARGTSGSMPKISNKDILEVQVRLPAIQLQKRFVQFVQRVETVGGRQMQSTQEINELFHSLMNKAFRGELVV